MSFIERALKKIKDDQERQQRSETPAAGVPEERTVVTSAAPAPEPAPKPIEHVAREVAIRDRLLKAEMLVPGGLGQKFIDEYRRIKRPLLANAFGKSAALVDHGNLVLVTSSVPNEGKSFTAVNLALAIAQERDNTVLMVDCDSVRKAMSRMLGVENETGLTDVLEMDGIDIADVILRTDIPDLAVIPAGSATDKVTELYASRKMSDLVTQLISRYSDRVIIFDSPPLLVTTQTQVLAGLVGQVVMVVHAGGTPVEVVKQALELLPSDKAVGVVLNKSANLFRSYTRGYDGYYGYEEYS